MENKDHVAFSDGNIEQKIAAYLKANDGNYGGIIEAIPEGAVFHNFVSARENLLRWYPLEKNSRVLEIGSGMGALTPFLAERCAHVVALEPSAARAEIVALRCQHFDNVTVVNQSLDAYETDDMFDYILMIGVLEYAAIGSDRENPWQDMLHKAKSFLKLNGKLLLAIENKFGLKYWCGAAEDHTGIPFDSVNDYCISSGTTSRYNGNNGVRTFSKVELETLLEDAGFPVSKFYYMLPDYKFPMVALSDESQGAESMVGDLKYNYPEESKLIANESMLYPQIARNRALSFFANSYLVEAGVNEGTSCGVITATMKRDYKSVYRMTTVIDDNYVYRYADSKDSVAHVNKLIENTKELQHRGIPCVTQEKMGEGCTRAEIIKYPRADDVFGQAMASGNLLQAINMIDLLQNYLKRSSEMINLEGKLVLRNGYLDMTFRNSFWVNGDLLFFDQEWNEENVPLKYIVYRSIRYGFSGASESMKQAIFDYCGISTENLADYSLYEAAFLKSLMDEERCRWFDGTMYQERLTFNGKVDAQLRNKDAHIEQLLQSERDLMEEKSHLQNELIFANGEIQQLRGKENDLSGRLSNTENEVQQLRDKENSLKGMLSNAENEVQQLRDKENSLKGMLSNAENEVQQLRSNESILKIERDVLGNRVAQYSNQLNRQKETEEELRRMLLCTEGERNQLRDKENQLLHTLSVKDEEYAALQYELACRNAECQQLRDKENQLKADLEATRNSRTWRLARVFAGFVRFFVPVGSKRALILRLLWTFIKHPFKFLKNLTPRKLKKFFRMLRQGNIEGIKLLINSNITGQPAPSMIEVSAPEVVPVELEPVREKTAADYPAIQVPQWEKPQVSIIIPVYNQFEFTYHCVESIIKNSGDITYEIIIANDCSTDLTTQIDDILPGVNCITNEKNLRFLLNCNNAAKHAKGQYVLFLNNDTQVQPNWLEPLVTLIESADDIGMVGSKLIYPDGLLQEAGGILWKDGSAWNFGNRQNPALPQFNYVKQVDYISGAAIMLSRELWEEIGGFDETFVPAYCEDSDLAFTVRKMGYRVMYQPLSVVVHFEGVSNGTDTSSGQKHYQVVNSKKFREKWAEELAKHPDNAENVFQARDYSFGKPTLLMVDHYVPHFDKDAGSRTVYQYLKLFVNAGFNVKFIGDNFYQHEPYTTALQQMGIEVLYGPECAQHWKDWIRENAEHFDYVFLNRPHIAPKYLEFIRENTNAKIMYYGHDLAFLREMREYEITGDASFRDSSIEWKPKEIALMKAADMAYYPSYVEVDEIHAIDPTVKVKAIPAYLFENVTWEGYDYENRKDIMFIGGFGHRPNVDAVKWVAEEILPELLKYLPDVKIHILGSNAPKEVLNLANDHLIMEGFVTDEQLEWFYRNMRISLVPLRYGAGIKGKVVEAMRYGTPVVTTSTGAEGIPDAEKAMLIEDDAKQLAKKLAELYSDAERLASMSENCIEYIQNNYSPSNAISIIGSEFGLS